MRGAARDLSFKRSSHFRITLWYTLLLGLVSIAFGAFIFLSQLRDIYGESRFRITKAMDEVGRSFDDGSPIHAQADDKYAIFDAEGRILRIQGLTEEEAGSLAASARGAEAFGDKGGHRGKPVAWIEEGGGAEMLYGYAPMRGGPKEAEAAPGASRFILFGSALDPYGLRGRLLATLLVAIAFMLAIAMLSGAWLANRAMRPVALIARTARSIGEGDLSRRIRLGSRDELGELAAVFDAMLDRLEAAFERQRRFVADAGHELRTPLSIISLESERSLSSERRPDEYRQSLEVVRTECGYMSRLVEALLALARADSGGAERSEGRVDLSDVAVEVLERFSPLATRRGIALSAGELPELEVRGDRSALATALGNLVDNAIKYGRQGGSVRLALSSSGGNARLSVADDGPGIPAEKLGRVFDRFFRVDEARSEGEGGPTGSGLGLAIVKAIVESHGGSASVRSELGRGAEFAMLLPLAEGSES